MSVTRLTCAAPHPDRPGQTCGSLVAYAGAGFEIVGTARRAPEEPEHVVGTVWMRCHRSSCGAWTQFRIPSRQVAA